MDSPPDTTDRLLAQAGWMTALARRLVHDPNTADDVVQETFASALTSPPAADRLRPWLARIARNVVRMRARSESARAARERWLASEPEGLSAADLAQKLESQRLLADAVQQLAEPYRATILLHYWEHKSSDDIAALHGVPAGTVRWRLKHGVDLLRAGLDSSHKGGRHAWCTLIAPLTGNYAPAASTTLVAGMLGMNLFAKSSLVVAAIAVLGSGIWFAADGLQRDRAAQLPSRQVVAESRPATERSVPGLPSEPDAMPAAAAPTTRFTVDAAPTAVAALEARVIDDEARAIPDARVICLGSTRVDLPAADRSGYVKGTLMLAVETLPLSFVVEAPGCATRMLHATAKRGETTFLGDIVLQPGGAVSGRAIDGAGQPVAGARIGIDAVDVPQSELMHRSQSMYIGEPSTVTAADGTFALAGLPVGPLRVVGASPLHQIGYSQVVEIHRGNESAGVVIELEAIPANRIVHGIVLDPDGQPVADASIEYRAATLTGSNTGSARVNAEGRFREIVRSGARVTLVAHDERGRWADVAQQVRPSGEQVVLQFAPARWLEVTVSSSSGASIERFAGSAESPDHRNRYASIPGGRHEHGRARMLVPATPFVLRVEAAAHLTGEVGPFDPTNVPATIDVQLQAVPGITGHVFARDRAVAGARVTLHAIAATHTEVNGFPVLVQRDALDEVRSLDDGSYLLTPRTDGRFVVRVEAEGYAPAESRTLDIEARRGEASVDVWLGDGGSIAGRVLVAAGRDAAGTIVAISRGDGFAQTVRVGREGRYSFAGLMPGRWLVRANDVELDTGSTSTITTSGRVRDIPWSCEVVDGRATHFDLDLRTDRAACTLFATLVIRGSEIGAWNATWRPAADFASPGAEPTVALDPAGVFQLSTPSPAKMTILLTALRGPFEGLRIMADVDVDIGQTRREIAFDAATITIDRPRTPAAHDMLFHIVGIDAQTVAIKPFPQAAEPSPAGVPAGPGRIALPPSESADRDPRKWPALIEVTLAPGESKRVTPP